ncbi:MAG TPA: acetylglutamate kinase [Spirochaetota bacterium]|nr:acetylglutamate kinase [Spirochaetota bacterium]
MQNQDKAKILSEALPYIRRFHKKIMVIKVGGSVMDKPDELRRLMRDIVLLKYVGMMPVVVHGGGKHITSLMNRLGKKNKFINGLRVTDKETMQITQMVLAGQVNKDLVTFIAGEGGKAVGLSGKDGNLMQAVKLEQESDLGYVGKINSIDTTILDAIDISVFIPVISPVTADSEGSALNINADNAATELAIALNAEKLIYITDINGVRRDVNDSKTRISKIHTKEIPGYIRENIIQTGMVPKMQAAAEAVHRGVQSIHIISGKAIHALLLELFTDAGVGTQIIP